MWIALGILALLITGILLLPVYVIVKYEHQDGFTVRFRFLGKLYGAEDGREENPIVKRLKAASGLSRLDQKQPEEKKNPVEVVKGKLALITDLFRAVKDLLKRVTVKKLKVKIVCADECAATAAVNYGLCYAVAAPVLGYLQSNLRIDPKGREIQIACDYTASKGSFFFETVLSVRIYRILLTLLQITKEEAKRGADK